MVPLAGACSMEWLENTELGRKAEMSNHAPIRSRFMEHGKAINFQEGSLDKDWKENWNKGRTNQVHGKD